MSPIDWALQPLKRYADFEGRSPRAEYWWFSLFQWIAYIALFVIWIGIAAGTASPDGPSGGFWLVFVVFMLLLLGLFLPNLAVLIRRLHDQDLSGWFCLLFFIPYIGGLIAIVFMCIGGTRGPNRFGPDPYDTDHLEQVFA